MPESLVLAPTADPRVFVAPDGTRHRAPEGWICVPPGDAALTRRLKQAGPSWAVVEKRGRKTFSKGLWVPAENVGAIQDALASERSTESYARKRQSDTARREAAQASYVVAFEAEVASFLGFAPRWAALGAEIARRVAAHAELAGHLADAVTTHATPVGSGTVARTQRIPVGERAEAAVIAWMRHQTTAYDAMNIPRIAGKRREVRRELAQISRAVLDLHRRDQVHDPRACSLCSAAGALQHAG
jgi:hypothetical protein